MNPEVQTIGVPSPSITMIRIEDLEPDREQGRKRFDPKSIQGLAESLRVSGVLEPLIVRCVEDTQKYRIIDGERRWRAAKLAGIATIPCIISDGKGWALVQLVANFQREDLNPLERGLQIKRTMEQTGMDAKAVAQQAGLHYQTVLKYLRLLEGPDFIKEAVSAGVLVPAEDYETCRRLDFEQALEALRLYTNYFEPSDRSKKKHRALGRLKALVTKALAEGWNRSRWRLHARLVEGERRKNKADKVTAEPVNDGSRPSTTPTDEAQKVPEIDGLAVVTCKDEDSAMPENGSVTGNTHTLPQILDMLDAAVANASAQTLQEVANRLDSAIERVSEIVAPALLFAREGRRLVIYTERLEKRPVDPFQRSALINQVEGVLTVARRSTAT